MFGTKKRIEKCEEIILFQQQQIGYLQERDKQVTESITGVVQGFGRFLDLIVSTETLRPTPVTKKTMRKLTKNAPKK
jgi:hypothetical protein